MNSTLVINDENLNSQPAEKLQPEDRARIVERTKQRFGVVEPTTERNPVIDSIALFCSECHQAEVSENQKICSQCVIVIANRAQDVKLQREGRIFLAVIGIVALAALIVGIALFWH